MVLAYSLIRKVGYDYDLTVCKTLFHLGGRKSIDPSTSSPSHIISIILMTLIHFHRNFLNYRLLRRVHLKDYVISLSKLNYSQWLFLITSITVMGIIKAKKETPDIYLLLKLLRAYA